MLSRSTMTELLTQQNRNISAYYISLFFVLILLFIITVIFKYFVVLISTRLIPEISKYMQTIEKSTKQERHVVNRNFFDNIKK